MEQFITQLNGERLLDPPRMWLLALLVINGVLRRLLITLILTLSWPPLAWELASELLELEPIESLLESPEWSLGSLATTCSLGSSLSSSGSSYLSSGLSNFA